MATQKSTTNAVNFLPEVFRTEPNRQVLSSSLDVLTSQPDFARVEGFIGNKYGYAVEPKDRYVVEPTKTRADYQLTPSLVFLKDNTQTARDFIDYPGLIQALSNQKSITTDPNRLFESQFYSWESFTNIDMIVNYSQYYWLPLGPDSVAITTPLSAWLATIGKHGWDECGTYDVLVVTLATLSSVFTTVKTYTSKDWHAVSDKAGIENATSK